MTYTVKDLVLTPGNRCVFRRLDHGYFWYAVLFADRREEFEFPLPEHDMAGTTFLAEDTPKFFMRWIRQHVERLNKQAGLERVAFDRYEDHRLWYRTQSGFEFPVPFDREEVLQAHEFLVSVQHHLDEHIRTLAEHAERGKKISEVVKKKWARGQSEGLYGPVVGYSEVNGVLCYDVLWEDNVVRPVPAELLTVLEAPTCTNMIGFVVCGERDDTGPVYCSDSCMNRGK